MRSDGALPSLFPLAACVNKKPLLEGVQETGLEAFYKRSSLAPVLQDKVKCSRSTEVVKSSVFFRYQFVIRAIEFKLNGRLVLLVFLGPAKTFIYENWGDDS